MIPKLRRNDDGDIQAFIPIAGMNEEDAGGEWVNAIVAKAGDMATIACDPTSDGFQPVYRCTTDELESLLEGGDQVANVSSWRCNGTCRDKGQTVQYEVTSDDSTLTIAARGRSYRFPHDTTYSIDDITPEMVTMVVNYLDGQENQSGQAAGEGKAAGEQTFGEQTFFDVLQQVFAH
jgi:hypothetical protein